MRFFFVTVLALIGTALAASPATVWNTSQPNLISSNLIIDRFRRRLQVGWKHGKLRLRFLLGKCSLYSKKQKETEC